jgi:adenosine deaminase
MGFIEEMPKIDLHYHLDGGLRPQTVIDIAQKENIELPAKDTAGITPYLTVGDNCKSLNEYLEKFDLPLKCLQSPYSQRRVAKEAVEDAAAQNEKYIEVRFAPSLMTSAGQSISEVVGNVAEGLKEGEKLTGVRAQAILCCMRHQDAKVNIEVVKAAKEFLGKGVCALDLAGDEADFPPKLHKEAFKLAQSLGVPVTIHAGEAGGAQNIYDSIEELGALRIGHGIRLKEDKNIFETVKQKRTPLEICVTSNVQTKAAQSFETHPIREYFDAGIVVTVNTDNTTVSNTNLSREFHILEDKFGFTHAEMKQLALNAANSAFLSEKEKKELAAKINEEFDALMK